MKLSNLKRFNEYTLVRPPKHELIDIGEYPSNFLRKSGPVYLSFYRISIKYGLEDEKERGFMYFSSPNQPIEWETEEPWQGYFINITEKLISNNQHLDYSFLNYGLHEPLYLEQEEEVIITQNFKSALHEFTKNFYSLELILAYCNIIFAHVAQFYERQFDDRKDQYNHLVKKFFSLLNGYYTKPSNNPTELPSVHYFANQLSITPNYLSDLIKYYSGQSTLDHIHQHIIREAKRLLSEKSLSISEVAFRLGFEYPSYFTRLFKKSTGFSPSQFRNK